MLSSFAFFFFQAEDGIRVLTVLEFRRVSSDLGGPMKISDTIVPNIILDLMPIFGPIVPVNGYCLTIGSASQQNLIMVLIDNSVWLTTDFE